MRWLLSKDGQVTGPHEEAAIQYWFSQGQIQPGTHICREGDSRWLPFERSTFAEPEPPRKRSLVPIVVALVTLPFGGFALYGGVASLRGKREAVATATPSASGEPKLPLSEIYAERERADAERTERLRAQCVLRIPGSSSPVPLFPTEEGYDEWGSASAAGDSEAAEVAARANGAFLVEPGTKCSPVDMGFMSSRVRVVNGPHAGRSGWIPNEWRRGAR